jgi:uncharacterized protein YjbI with pentapeptide repeats
MANPKHLALLKKNIFDWNAWRKENFNEFPDLTEANLPGANLTRANLTGANFARPRLVRADPIWAGLTSANIIEQGHLSTANLTEAKLTGASLIKANLTGVHFTRADLIEADLSWANLTKADLSWANLNGADLRKAKLSEAVLYYTILGDTNLIEAEGLDSCRHLGPSIIDHQTPAKSGNLPLAFLRGCGLPDLWIEYLPSLLNQPIQFYSCFISYSTKDEEFARRLHADLQNSGVRCWFAPEDMKIGDKIRTQIDEVIRIHDKLLLVLSQYSVNSEWVEKEVETAFEKERDRKETVLFPIRLDDAVMKRKTGWPADIQRARHIGDFRQWKEHDAYKKAFDRLLRDLKAKLRAPPS